MTDPKQYQIRYSDIQNGLYNETGSSPTELAFNSRINKMSANILNTSQPVHLKPLFHLILITVL